MLSRDIGQNLKRNRTNTQMTFTVYSWQFSLQQLKLMNLFISLLFRYTVNLKVFSFHCMSITYHTMKPEIHRNPYRNLD